MSHHINATMGSLMIAGGVFAFFKKGSLPSLVGGGLVGSLFLLSSYMIKEGQYKNGHLFGSFVSLLTSMMFAQRFQQSTKFMPAGLIFGLSTVAFIYNAQKYRQFFNS